MKLSTLNINNICLYNFANTLDDDKITSHAKQSRETKANQGQD